MLVHTTLQVFESTVFPPDDTWFRQNTAADTGNGVINYTVGVAVL